MMVIAIFLPFLAVHRSLQFSASGKDVILRIPFAVCYPIKENKLLV